MSYPASVIMPNNMAKKIKKIAADNGQSLASYVRYLIVKEIKANIESDQYSNDMVSDYEEYPKSSPKKEA